jgi:hypothetical protein
LGAPVSSFPLLTQSQVTPGTNPVTLVDYAGKTWSTPLQYGGTVQFIQTSPSFQIGQAVYNNGTTWQRASATTTPINQTVGIITAISGTTYTVTLSGPAVIGSVAGGIYPGVLTPNQIYYLSSVTPGLGVLFETGSVQNRPLFIAISATQVIVLGIPNEQSYTSIVGTGPSNLLVGKAVQCTGNNSYSAAESGSLSTAQVAGVVTRNFGTSGSGSIYEIATSGIVEIGNLASQQYPSSLLAGNVYYLSNFGAGTVTAPAPSSVSEPIFVALSATKAALIPSIPTVTPPATTPGVPKAWALFIVPANYSGTGVPITMLKSFNISSITTQFTMINTWTTANQTIFLVNFTNAMSSANYIVIGNGAEKAQTSETGALAAPPNYTGSIGTPITVPFRTAGGFAFSAAGIGDKSPGENTYLQFMVWDV